MHSSTEQPHTLGALLESVAGTRPGAVAVEHGDRQVGYAELHRLTLAAADRLRGAGLGPGRTAALLFDQDIDCLVALLAVARTGARLIPAEPTATPDQLAQLEAETGRLTVLGRPERLRRFAAAGHWSDAELVDAAALCADAGTRTPGSGVAAVRGDEPFLIQYSSGSTGAPKAALHTQDNLVQGGLIYRQVFGYDRADTVLLAVPLLHSFGLVAGLVTSLLTGARLVLLGRFVPARLQAELVRTQADVLVATPLAYDLLARAAVAGTALPHPPRLCLSSGAPLPPQTAELLYQRLRLTVTQVYGCTEAGIIACEWGDADGSGSAPGVGRPVPGVEIRLSDEAGRPVGSGGAGALEVRTPAMFTGYLQRPEATAEVLRDGWYTTGDLARLDARGRLHLIGRKDTFVNIGGKKVNPLEVEQALLRHPLVAEAVVWGDPLPQGGEQVRAAVVPRGGSAADLTSADLTRHCRELLQPHQVPSRLEFTAELPRSSSGKIRRAAVAAAAATAPAASAVSAVSAVSDREGARS